MTIERPGLDPAVDELDDQVERGSMFTQAVLQRAFERLSAAEEQLAELADALVVRGTVTPGDLPVIAQARARAEAAEGEARGRSEAQQLAAWPAIAVRVDHDPPTGEPVDCAERLHICKAICCTLRFPLSAEEIDAGVVKWDIGHPYVIRQRSDGWCTHNDADTGGCDVYENRPGVCQRYTCRRDKRIWADFDGMVLNEPWLAHHAATGNGTLHFSEDEGGPS